MQTFLEPKRGVEPGPRKMGPGWTRVEPGGTRVEAGRTRMRPGGPGGTHEDLDGLRWKNMGPDARRQDPVLY